MSGSLAGQLFSQVFFTIRGGGPSIIDVAMISNVFSSLRHTVHAFSVLRSPSGRCLLSAGFALQTDTCDGLKSLECINSNL